MQEYKARPRERAEELLEGYVLEHGLQAGDRLPAERELSQLWGLSRATLRTAMDRLERDGLLYSREGSGNYVAPPKYNRDLRGLLSMSQAAAVQGLAVSTQMLEGKAMECGKDLARRFGRMLGAPVYKIARLRLVNGAPLMLETSFIPAELAPGLTGKELERRLDEVHITANKNAVPDDPEKPFVTSGIRVGTPAVTTRGLREADMTLIARCIVQAATDFEEQADSIRETVNGICARYPLYE